MRKVFLAFGIFLAMLCAGDAQMVQSIVNANTAASLTACTTTEQYALNSTPNGCNLVLFNQGLYP